MENYFNYFTEIEQRFQQRRGSILFLSTLDWALIETWREAGVPLEAVLRGIDSAFDRYDARKQKAGARGLRQVNGLAWCAQEVMTAIEEMKEAATGAAKSGSSATPDGFEDGFEQERIANHLVHCAKQLRNAALAGLAGQIAEEMASRLDAIAEEMAAAPPDLERLERELTVLDEKLFTALVATTAEAELLRLREQSAGELAPYRRRMQAVQIRQIEQQFLHKRLLEAHKLPRLSLFYMGQA